jgi:hypothetical protein
LSDLLKTVPLNIAVTGRVGQTYFTPAAEFLLGSQVGNLLAMAK